MYARPPRWSNVVSLIPETGIQLLDVDINVSEVRTTRSFTERVAGSEVEILPLDADPDTGHLRTANGEIVPETLVYSANGQKALEVFADEWIPLPFLRVRDRMPDGRRTYAVGPSDWARGRIVERPEPDADGNTHRLVLAFDTTLEPEVEGRPYAAPSPENARYGEDYGLAAGFDDIAWFLQLPWVETWLRDVHIRFHERRVAPRRFDPATLPHRCEHWALYLSLLTLFARSRRVPDVRFVDTVSDPVRFQPIGVDLVLDVGNSRTCGILVESAGARAVDLTNAYPLELRDLTHPEHVGPSPFPSRLEFSQARFGRTKLARRSGRLNPSFSWPSPVRVGDEAVRLSYLSDGTEGNTGLSSPKRYLWDTDPQPHDWRYNAGPEPDGHGERAVTQGPLLVFICDDGEDVEERSRAQAERGQSVQVLPAINPRFSRSSLMTFFLVEIFLQAFTLINSPGKRYQRANSDLPRTLRRVILTVPTAMPLPERRIFQRRIDNALKYVRRMLRLGDEGGRQHPVGLPTHGIVQWDESTGTQMVFLYTELTQSFRGDAHWLFEMCGRLRGPGRGGPTLRIASVDVGGGTTDLIITTYRQAGERAIVPTQEFREGFNTAGDDILRAIIEHHVLAPVAAAVERSGVADAGFLLADLLGDNRASHAEIERTLRRQFTEQVAMPIGLQLIALYEDFDPVQPSPAVPRRLGDFFAGGPAPTQRVVEYFEAAVRRAGGADFSLFDTVIDVDLAAIHHTAERTIGDVLSALSEVIHRYGCDYLLLSGRSCRMPAVASVFLAKLPVPPDRLKSMHRYRVGPWYPFRDARGRLDDPKTTAAMGALVCTLSQGHLEHFHLRSGDMRMRSTMRFIGLMEQVPQIKRRNILLENIDLDDEKAREAVKEFDLDTPVVIGFRQLDLERWPATPIYRIDFRRPGEMRPDRLPLKVEFRALPAEEDTRHTLFALGEVADRDGTSCGSELVLRLQTLKDTRGYWTDTGILLTP